MSLSFFSFFSFSSFFFFANLNLPCSDGPKINIYTPPKSLPCSEVPEINIYPLPESTLQWRSWNQHIPTTWVSALQWSPWNQHIPTTWVYPAVKSLKSTDIHNLNLPCSEGSENNLNLPCSDGPEISIHPLPESSLQWRSWNPHIWTLDMNKACDRPPTKLREGNVFLYLVCVYNLGPVQMKRKQKRSKTSKTRKHSSRIRTIRRSGRWGRGVSAHGGYLPRGQNDWQTGVKTLPCRNYVADGNKDQSKPQTSRKNSAFASQNENFLIRVKGQVKMDV